jgi:SSS family solute:Na+ symporter
VGSSKEVYGVMIRTLLPTGVLGIMAASLMAALMGNLASAANSISTLFSYDLLKRFRPATSDRALVLSGRLASFCAFVVGIALVPALDRYESVFAGAQDIICHIAPPITTVFLVGIFWSRASSASARWTMWIGSAAGALIFTLKTLHKGWPDTFAWVPSFVLTTPFMMMAFYLFVFCVALQVTFTLSWPKQAHEDPERLYWEHPLDALRTPGWPGLANYKVLSAVLFGAMTLLYITFH